MALGLKKCKLSCSECIEKKVALVPICQLLEGHGRRVNQRVQQVQTCLIHEPREFIHQAPVTNGRQVDQRRTILGLEITSACIEVDMGKHILGSKCHTVQIAALQLKRRFLRVNGALLHEKIWR